MRKFSFLSLLVLSLAASCSQGDKASSAQAPAAVASPENAANPQVKMETSEGEITLELFADLAPISTANFLAYVEKKHFDNTIFHRVMKSFMIQGGGFENQNGNFVEKATLPAIKNENSNGLKNRRGTLAMARTNDPDSATAQFYINTVDNASLDTPPGYAVFGKVLAGMEVVDTIERTPTATLQLSSRQGEATVPGPHANVPQRMVLIKSVTKIR